MHYANIRHNDSGRRVRAVLSVLGAGLSLLLAGQTQAALPTGTGVACTAGPNFTLTATDGYIQLPDGNTAYSWGYGDASGKFQLPGPVLCVNEGQTVTVVLNNALPEAVSIMFPGQEGVSADGALAQPTFSGTTLTSLTNAAPTGGSITYSFVASRPGTYLYESGTNPKKQVRMGLYGALIVRPTGTYGGPNHVFNRTDSQFTTADANHFNEEFLGLLSEIDPFLNQAVELNRPYKFDNYKPRYWLINGRGFPDSINDNFSPLLPDQPYGALVRIHPFDDAPLTATHTLNHPSAGVVRFLSTGSEEFPQHPHGQNGLVIGRDGMPVAGPTGQDLSAEKFVVNVGPGQTWDVLFKWFDVEKYDSTSNPVPVTIPAVNNQEFGIFYSGSPYLGKTGALPPGASTLNQCGEYYVISHNHALYQITSWGVNLTGPITYLRVDPPMPNTCP